MNILFFPFPSTKLPVVPSHIMLKATFLGGPSLDPRDSACSAGCLSQWWLICESNWEKERSKLGARMVPEEVSFESPNCKRRT